MAQKQRLSSWWTLKFAVWQKMTLSHQVKVLQDVSLPAVFCPLSRSAVISLPALFPCTGLITVQQHVKWVQPLLCILCVSQWAGPKPDLLYNMTPHLDLSWRPVVSISWLDPVLQPKKKKLNKKPCSFMLVWKDLQKCVFYSCTRL